MHWQPLSRSELEALQSSLGPRDAALIGLMAHTGLRVAEAVGLNSSDAAAGWLAVSASTAKGGRARRIPLNGPAEAAIGALRKEPAAGTENPDYPLARSASGRRLSARWVQKAIAAGGSRIGRHVHPHLLRHYFITTLAERGVPLMVIRDLAGHRNLSTTNVYLHSSSGLLVDAVRQLE